MAWIWLGLAIIAEVIGTSALKAADGFTRLGPALAVVAAYAVAFYCLSLVLREIPVGIAYAVWSGAGIVLVSLIGWLWYGQTLPPIALAGIGLILAGTVLLNLASGGHGPG
jgi:small multidrug resistance pump